MTSAAMPRDEAAHLYRELRSVAVREFGWTADEFDQYTRGLGTTPADFVQAAEWLLEHARENQQPLPQAEPQAEPQTEPDAWASIPKVQLSPPSRPHMSAKQFEKMMTEMRERMEEIDRALGRHDSNGIPVIDCGEKRELMWEEYEWLNDQLCLEDSLAHHYAYGPYAEHPSVRRWA